MELGNLMEIFDYDNVLLLPRKCRVESRSECDASVELGSRTFRIPVVPANMKTVVDEKLCLWLAQHGYFYSMHRFDLDNFVFVRKMKSQGAYASISGTTRHSITYTQSVHSTSGISQTVSITSSSPTGTSCP